MFVGGEEEGGGKGKKSKLLEKASNSRGGSGGPLWSAKEDGKRSGTGEKLSCSGEISRLRGVEY